MTIPLDRTGDFLAALDAASDRPVAFAYRGTRARAGYHVTEIKRASITAIDCGRVGESWEELVVELLDGDALPGKDHLTASKLRGIVAGAAEAIGSGPEARLIVEFGAGNAEVRRLAVDSAVVAGDEIVVTLGDTRARCKPLRRAARPVVDRIGGCCGGPENAAEKTRRRCCG